MKERYDDDGEFRIREPDPMHAMRRGVDPVHAFVFSDDRNIVPGYCFACCPSGWWIVGADTDVDKTWTDLGPYDSFETAVVVFKLLGL